MKVKFEGRTRTYGNFRLEPACPVSKTMAACFRSKFLKIPVVKLLIKNGGEVFYSGRKDKELDDLGLKFVEEK